MIFDKNLEREIRALFGMILILLLTILLVVGLMRVLDAATSVSLPPKEVFFQLLITTLSRMQNIVAATFFMTILLVFSRLNHDGEMAAWLASGVSRFRFVKPVIKVALPVSGAILLIACVIVPWSNRLKLQVAREGEARDDIGFMSSGQFRESSGGNRVLYVNKINEKKGSAEQIFLMTKKEKEGQLIETVIFTDKAEFTKDDQNRRSVMLMNGRGVQGNLQTGNFYALDFDRYNLFLNEPGINYASDEARYKTMTELVQSEDSLDEAELFWRLSFPMMIFVLSFLAVPLAFVRPRSGKAMHGLTAFVVYMIYNNTAAYVSSLIGMGKMDLWRGFVLLHGGMVVFSLFVLSFHRISWEARRLWGVFFNLRVRDK
jgi:lipopolysaccharide export system permease protein